MGVENSRSDEKGVVIHAFFIKASKIRYLHILKDENMNKMILILITTINQVGKFFGDASAFANFCTILLFVIFVIGKIWILFRNRSLYNENFEYLMVDESEEFNCQFMLGGQDTIKLSSPDGIYDVKIYKIIERNKKGTRVTKRELISAKNEDNIYHPLKLNKNEAVYIRTDLPCGAPCYQIQITKFDYVKIIAELGSNGKVGGVSLVNRKTKYGIRSFLYYLCE